MWMVGTTIREPIATRLSAVALAVCVSVATASAQTKICPGMRAEPAFDHPMREVRPSGDAGLGFGVQVHPLFRVKKLHAGIDYLAPAGTEVIAAEAGHVTFSERSGGYGNHVRIEHGRGDWETLYAHLNDFTVKSGDCVAKGQVIGHVGSTGDSTGPHLHFEVRRIIDPATVLPPPK